MIPDDWFTFTITLLHKKGYKLDPANYRVIALINHCSKLFTSMLNRTLEIWVESNKVISETQAGFQKNKSCMDNLFNLSTAIQSRLRQDKAKLYALFVDFKRAFDSINHKLLWLKLYNLGLSVKVIQILKNIYDSASFCVKSNNKLTRDFSSAEGVLQGEILSPLLFVLYITDLETIYREHSCEGININGTSDILVLLYADDLVILGNSENDLRRKLDLLHNYCQTNKLTVNTQKTKIIYCRKAGRISSKLTFNFDHEPIEIAEKYGYLGLTVSPSGFSRQTAVNTIKKAKSALSMVSSIISASRIDSGESIFKPFDSIVAATLLYASPIWALSYLELIEKIQCDFIKQIFGLSRTTANALLRIEFNRTHLAYMIVKNTWKYVVGILIMKDSKLPKICLYRLANLAKTDTSSAKTNWFKNFLSIIEKISPEIAQCLARLNLYTWCSREEEFLNMYKNSLL